MNQHQRFATWLEGQGIPCLSPTQGMLLATLLERLGAKMQTALPPEILEQAERYREAIQQVMIVATLQQGMVIERLQALVKGERNGGR